MSKRAGFDTARVVRVRISVDKAAGTYQFGSGYIVAPEFVFTAGHVLSFIESTSPVAGAKCEVHPLGSTSANWQPGEVVWAAESKRDVALVRVARLGASLAPARLGRLEGIQPVKWRAIGFPVASLDDSGRKEEDAWGEVSPITGQSDGQLGLTVQSRQARAAVVGESGWAGLSGAAVFSGDALVGLVIKDPSGYDRSLVGKRIETIANDAALRQLLGDALSVESIFDIGNCRRRRQFDALLESYGKGFGGRGAVLDDLQSFLRTPSRSHLIVEAPGGFGKSAVLANLVASHRFEHPYHFLRHDEQTPQAFFANLLEQFMALAGEEGGARPDDVAWMQGRLMELAETLANGNHVVVVDGLDEVSWDAAAYTGELQKAGMRTLTSMRWEGTGAMPTKGNAETLRLQGLTPDDIGQVLHSVGVSSVDVQRGLVAEISRIARTDEPEFEGADPFVARFIAEDVAGGQIDAAALGDTSPGVETYLEKWFSEMIDSAGTSNSASIWAIRFLASAKGPMPARDLEALIGSTSEQVIRPTLSNILAPVRRHLSESAASFRLAHRRLADFVRTHCDSAADARRITEHCTRWPTTGSAYALRYLVPHLLDSGEDQAIWDLLSHGDGLGGNPWYLAHLEAAPITANTQVPDPLQSYLADLDAVARRAEDLASNNRPHAATVRLRAAALQSTFVSIAHRIPDELLKLLATEGGRLVAAISLALRRSRAHDRAAILVQLVAAVGGGEGCDVVVHHAMQAIADCPASDRAQFLAHLAPDLDHATAVDAVALLKTPLDGWSWSAARALAERMQANEKFATLSMASAGASEEPNPFYRTVRLAALTPESDREQAVDAVVALVTAAVELLQDEADPDGPVVEASIWLAGERPSSWCGAFDLIRRVKPEARARRLGSLATTGPDEATIPCIDALLELDPSDERSDALAGAIPRLSDENTTALLQNVTWDFHELARIAPVLREPFRGQVATQVFNYVSKPEPPDSALAPLIGGLAPYLPESERGGALQLLLALAAQTPPVPPHEDVARQALAMLRITKTDTGEVVDPTVHIGVTRAELLTMAAVADPPQRRFYVNQALRAAIAVGDHRPRALLLAALASHADPKSKEPLAAEALRVALAITWDATLSETLCQVVPALSPELRSTVREALARIETPDRKAEVEYALLAQERPIPAALCDGLPAAIVRFGLTPLNVVLAPVAVELPDTTVIRILDALERESGSPTEEDSEATIAGILRILAGAGRLSLDQAFAASAGKLEITTVAELLRRAAPAEQQKLADRTFNAIKSLPEATKRVAALGTVREALVGSGSSDVFGAQIETDLTAIDIARLALPELANIVPVLPAERRSAAVQALLDRRQVIHPDDWGELVAQLATAAPTHLLSGLLSSLARSGAAARTKALALLATEIARREDDEAVWSAWQQTLAMAERDPRWYFLEELRHALPLAARVWGNEMVPAVRDVVQRVAACFP